MKELMTWKKALVPIAMVAIALAFGSGFAMAAHGGMAGGTQVSQADAAPAAVQVASDAAGAAQAEANQHQVDGSAGSKVARETQEAGPWAAGEELRVEDGTVYEYDDGRWEVEGDLKVEDGAVYEYDGGRWELEDDKYVEDGVVYENDDDDAYEDDGDDDDEDDEDDDEDDDDDDDEEDDDDD